MTAARFDYLPAVNALGQLYSEGLFVDANPVIAESYQSKAERLAAEKIELANALADAQSRSQSSSGF